MRKRSRMSRSKSKKDFRRKASGVHGLNIMTAPMRGGFRL